MTDAWIALAGFTTPMLAGALIVAACLTVDRRRGTAPQDRPQLTAQAPTVAPTERRGAPPT